MKRNPFLPITVFSLLVATVFFAVDPARACTSLTIKSADGGVMYGRTMEFGFELDSEAVVIPRNYAFKGTGPDGKPGKTWTSKYAATGMNAFKLPVLVDGVNEKGLAGGILYFPGYADYTTAADADAGESVAPWEFLTWVLTSFASVDEVKAAIDQVEVIGLKMPQLGAVPPFHYTVHDASGKSIVIEPIGGKLKVYDNPYGVMTNSPTFDWHLTNLSNYVKLTPENVAPLKVGGQEITSFGEGSGWLGIPGDPTPPSRFIRALAFSMTSDPEPAGEKSVRLVEHIMNNFDIPKGTIRNDEKMADYTQWTTVADLKNRSYYVKTYENQTLQGIDLMAFDLDAKEVVSTAVEPMIAPPALFKSGS